MNAAIAANAELKNEAVNEESKQEEDGQGDRRAMTSRATAVGTCVHPCKKVCGDIGFHTDEAVAGIFSDVRVPGVHRGSSQT